MKIQIKNFSTHQTAKVFAVLMAVTSLLFMLPFFLISMFANDTTMHADGFGMLFLFMPLVQGLFGYLVMRFGMWIYNKITSRVGGIEFEFEQVESKEGQ
ncbi:hypothetical protein [Paraglaciecola sp.]|uniref:hypothetical protein n=1 Tax=Paraglaciecola sp. TaxID=1920173 RepID=UPI0030F39135